MEPENELNKLRAEIREVDEALMQLIARRQGLARKVGQAKLTHQLPIKDYRVEKQVIETSRKRASELGLYEEAAEEITKALIKYSCQVQEEYQGRAKGRSTGTRQQIVIAGGLGQMGKWLARFFEAFGHAVSVVDANRGAGQTDFHVHDSLASAARIADVLILATPISATAGLLETLIPFKPKGLVLDICSLKSPVLAAIAKAKQSGMRVTSIHPMFGPNVQWLAGRNVVLCETGDEALTQEAAALFRDSTANLVRLPLERHDEFMGYILGLSHLSNLVFAATLEHSGLSLAELQAIGSTTFHAQAQVTEPVVAENADLYFEIQAENGKSAEVCAGMRAAFDQYERAILKGDRIAFKALMEKSRQYFGKQG